MTEQKRWIGVACVDWDNHVLVDSRFYPDDIPSDWYLTYYANFIMACVLSPEKWQQASREKVAGWCDQTQDNFWFYLLCESVEQLEQAAGVACFFDRKFAGLVLAPAIVNCAAMTDLVSLRIGFEVFSYDYENLRLAKPSLLGWLASEDSQTHALVLMSANNAHHVREVQMLLELLGDGT